MPFVTLDTLGSDATKKNVPKHTGLQSVVRLGLARVAPTPWLNPMVAYISVETLVALFIVAITLAVAECVCIARREKGGGGATRGAKLSRGSKTASVDEGKTSPPKPTSDDGKTRAAKRRTAGQKYSKAGTGQGEVLETLVDEAVARERARIIGDDVVKEAPSSPKGKGSAAGPKMSAREKKDAWVKTEAVVRELLDKYNNDTLSVMQALFKDHKEVYSTMVAAYDPDHAIDSLNESKQKLKMTARMLQQFGK